MRAIRNIKTILLALTVAVGLTFNYTGCENVPLEPETEMTAKQNELNIVRLLGPEAAAVNLGTTTASAWVTPETGGQLVMMYGDFSAATDSLLDYTDVATDSLPDYTDIASDSLGGYTDIGTDSLYDTSGSYDDSTSYGAMPGVKIELNVLPQSITAATELNLTLDGMNVDMDFGPNGLVFQNPALLNVTATGLDLSNVNEASLDIYYDNPGTGQWESVERENVIVTKSTGMLQIVNARIPHFSRYAVAWSQ